MKIPLSSPDITKKEISAVCQVLSTPTLSLGPYLEKIEKKVADFVGVKYAVGVSSGTAGLHLSVKAVGIKEGDEVITTPFSFIASSNCILYERAKPIFVDIDEETLNIDISKIEEKITKKTKAILCVHTFGLPDYMDKIMNLVKKYNLKVIEDACEAIGAEFKGKKVGSFGDVGVFAFYPNKQITTGEGGMIATNNKNIYLLGRSLRNQGREENNKWLHHKRLGYNYRLSEIQSAIGYIQMKRIKEILTKRERVANYYNERLKDIKGVKIPYSQPELKRSWFVYVIILDESFTKKDREKIVEELKKKNIHCSSYFPPIHLQPFYKELFGYKRGDFLIAEKISNLTIALPFYNNLSEHQIDYICKKLSSIINYYHRKWI